MGACVFWVCVCGCVYLFTHIPLVILLCVLQHVRDIASLLARKKQQLSLKILHDLSNTHDTLQYVLQLVHKLPACIIIIEIVLATL